MVFAVCKIWRKRWEAHRDVLALLERAVANSLARRSENRLPGAHVGVGSVVLDAKAPAQDECDLVELGLLRRLLPVGRRSHMRHADTTRSGCNAAGVLLDLLTARDRDGDRGVDESRHGRTVRELIACHQPGVTVGSAAVRFLPALAIALVLSFTSTALAEPGDPPAPTRGARASQYVFPIIGPIGQWHDDFGEARSRGAEQGNDIGCRPGLSVVAVTDGTIEQLSWGGGGWTIRLKADSGDQFLYLHLGRDSSRSTAFLRAVPNGAHVKQGQQIAWSGYSGNATAAFPHVEFQYLPHGGHEVSPYELLKAATRLSAPIDQKTTLTLAGQIASTSGIAITVDARKVRVGRRPAGPRTVTVNLAAATKITQNGAPATSAALLPGTGVVVVTEPASAEANASAATPPIAATVRIVPATSNS